MATVGPAENALRPRSRRRVLAALGCIRVCGVALCPTCRCRIPSVDAKTSPMRQTSFKFRSRGGRERARWARPPGPRARLRHARRPRLHARFPVHVTWRMRHGVWSLRTRRCFTALARALLGRGDPLRLSASCTTPCRGTTSTCSWRRTTRSALSQGHERARHAHRATAQSRDGATGQGARRPLSRVHLCVRRPRCGGRARICWERGEALWLRRGGSVHVDGRADCAGHVSVAAPALRSGACGESGLDVDLFVGRHLFETHADAARDDRSDRRSLRKRGRRCAQSRARISRSCPSSISSRTRALFVGHGHIMGHPPSTSAHAAREQRRRAGEALEHFGHRGIARRGAPAFDSAGGRRSSPASPTTGIFRR